MAADTDEKCVVGIRVSGTRLLKAFDVCIRGGTDIYVNYSDASTPEAHTSYHASGELHFKQGGRYIEWAGGPTGKMAPMRLPRIPPASVTARAEFHTIGWDVHRLGSILPPLDSVADMLVEAQQLRQDSILAFQVSAVGHHANTRASILGFPVFQAYRFGANTHVEIEAFIVSGESA